MATYNGSRYLAKQLASLERQAVKPLELVVVDDGSSDNTLEILEVFANSASFPVHLHVNPSRLGYRGNFMRAASLTVGELIAFCDQDDIWEPNKIEAVNAGFADQDVVLFFHGATLIDSEDAVIGPASIFSRPDAITEPLAGHSMVSPFGFSIAIHRSLMAFDDLWKLSIDSNEPDHRMGHDIWYYFLASIMGTIAYSEEPLVRYRQHAANAFGWVKDSRIQKMRFWLTNHARDYGSLAGAADRRAEILHRIARRSPKEACVLAQRGADKCERLSRFYTTRERFYRAGNPLTRIRLLHRLKRDGAYQGSDGFTLGRNALVKDLAIGLVLHPFLTMRR